jgi:pimeloyl-ACP methyl ester carboxylesterase
MSDRGHVLFVHGMYMTGKSWDPWVRHFESQGYTAHATSWPCHNGEPAQLRADPPKELADLTLDTVLDSYRLLLDGLDDLPLLVGHSMGGLVVQLLLQQGRGRAGVAIDSAPPAGISVLSWSFLKANAPVLGKVTEPIQLTPAQFRYAFCHTLSEPEAQVVFDAQVVPESRHVGKAPTTAMAKIDFRKSRPPLLMLAGELDHIIPAKLNRKNAKAYEKGDSRTDFEVLPGRTHWLCGDSRWQEVADRVLARDEGL